jgi:hypothetical protein
MGPQFGRRPVGRLYSAHLKTGYAGGRLPDEVHEAVAAEIGVRGGDARDLVVTVSDGPRSVLAVSATIEAGNRRSALAAADEAVDGALAATGLLEDFDITGKVLWVAPLELAERLLESTGPANI